MCSWMQARGRGSGCMSIGCVHVSIESGEREREARLLRDQEFPHSSLCAELADSMNESSSPLLGKPSSHREIDTFKSGERSVICGPLRLC